MAHGEGGGPARCGLEVHAVEDVAPAVGVDHVDGPVGHRLLGLLGGGADVVRADDARVLGEEGVELADPRAGLLDEHVETGP